MDHLVFAQDAGGFVSFCRQWGDAASVLGFVLSLSSIVVALVGFFLTLRGQRKIREAAESATRRAAYQLATTELGTLLWQLQGMHDAVLHQIWMHAIFRGREARMVMLSLGNNATLTVEERNTLHGLEEYLRRAIQYIEQRLIPQGQGVGALAPRHRRELDRILRFAGELRGRLQHLLMEV